jgi:transcriptional regulator with XRE-family HTH domain
MRFSWRIAKMLKELLESKMKERMLSTREVAKEIGVSHTTVFRALRGDIVDVPTLVKLAAWLNVQPSQLLNSIGKSKSNLPDKIAVVIDRNPDLSKAFEQVINAIEAGKVDPEMVKDIAEYAIYKLNWAIKGKK